MPRRCTVCDSPKRDEVDRALVAGASFRDISGQFPCLTKSAVARHAAEHLPEAQAKAEGAKEVARADDLLGQMRTLQKATHHILAAALGSGDHRTALGAVREARGNLELLGKLLGELEHGATVNVLITPEWRAVQAVILEALGPHTLLRQRVVAALLGIGAASSTGVNGSSGGSGVTR